MEISKENPTVLILAGKYAPPMRKNSEAYETLSMVFDRDSVPPHMIVDKSKEESLGEFKRKCLKSNCYLGNSEPYSPCKIAAERCIKELKKASSRNLISNGSPKVLWDHCIELMALIRSHTAHTAYELQGEVPETIMTRQTADITNICEYDCY